MDNEAIVRSFFLCWGAQDIELASMHFHEDMVYELHSVTRELPYAGVTRGRAACRDVMFTIIQDFDYLKYEAHIVSVEDDVVRAQVSFRYQHRRSREILDGTRRLVFRIKDGFIIRMDRYQDGQLVDAFMRLTRLHDATSAMPVPIELPEAIRRAPADRSGRPADVA
jgi:ketosteroid isomerase-like protein